MNSKYDAIIIGAGHNGLVTAAYLARAGRRVLVVERRELVGGCVVTEELWPGFKVSTASYVNSLFRPEIIRDLELKRHGFAMLPRSPSSFTPLPDGRYLMMGPDKEMTRREVSKFSRNDAENLPKFEAMLERVASFLEPMLVETPPNPPRETAMRALGVKYGPFRTLVGDRLKAYMAERLAVESRYPLPRGTIDDLMAHLLHALKLVGIDHVGIGLDWDGGGGVTGMEDVAGIPEISKRLLAAGYTQADLAKIWGGNALRVMRQVEAKAAELAHR